DLAALFLPLQVEDSELRVRRGAGIDDGAAAADLGAAAERRRIRSDLVDHALEHLADRDGSLFGDEGGRPAVALRLTFVLDRDRALDRVEIAVAPAIDIEMTRQRAVERRDGNRILDQGAAIGRPQLERRIATRGPDRPPDVAGVLDHAGA